MWYKDKDSPPTVKSCASFINILVCPLISVAEMDVRGKGIREMAMPATVECIGAGHSKKDKALVIIHV